MLQVVEANIDSLVSYKNNSKKHSEEQITQIIQSIEEFGNCDPIGVWTRSDGKLEIVEGHGRYEALKRLGVESVPVIKLDFLSDEQRQAYSHVHNQITLNSGLDENILAEEIRRLSEFDWSGLGFDDALFEMDSLIESDSSGEVEVPDEDALLCEFGDVFKIGDHIVICGDSTKAETFNFISESMNRIDLLLTDPPYGVDVTGATSEKMKIENDDLAPDDLERFLETCFTETRAILSPGTPFYIWGPHHLGILGMAFAHALRNAGFDIRQTLVWVKNVFTLGHQDYQNQYESCSYGWIPGAKHFFTRNRKQSTVLKSQQNLSRDEYAARYAELAEYVASDVFEVDKPTRSDLHPTMKPVKLFETLIRNSTRRGGVVLDIFAGSGTTLVATQNLGRKSICVEYDPKYASAILMRATDLVGVDPQKIGHINYAGS